MRGFACLKGFWAFWLLLLVLSSPSYSQSFDPAKSYQVTGAQLNRLEIDLQTAKLESAKQLELSQTLKSQLAESQSLLSEVQTQLKTASASLNRYERQTVVDNLIIGSVAAVAAALLVEVINLIIKP
jgi:hypothetical protein